MCSIEDIMVLLSVFSVYHRFSVVVTSVASLSLTVTRTGFLYLDFTVTIFDVFCAHHR